MRRSEFRKEFGTLITGGQTQCLADALAHALDVDSNEVRRGIGDGSNFLCAMAHVRDHHPNKKLIPACVSFTKPGGIKFALLDRTSGRFLLRMDYEQDNLKHHHFVFFDAGHQWKLEMPDGWVSGHGVLKDNQVDVKPCFVEASDRANVESARAFFFRESILQEDTHR